eukprot:GHVT01033052.1.p1 GENE.GHVT01033052.1~~GHVT01033052.1.p1  ORF type:complete len:190 (-),score=16.19 GHVT01033052.1:708-1277(-)
MSRGIPISKAIQQWDEKNGKSLAEETHVKLICHLPPIDKLDNYVNQLVACEKLSLSTNCIDRMNNLPGLKNLKILSLGRNQIKRIAGLEEVGSTLEQLWLSYNQIEKLDGLQPCTGLKVLYISHNKIKAWEEIDRLANLPQLVDVLFKGNPIYEGLLNSLVFLSRRRPHYASQAVRRDNNLALTREKLQ